jgi:hypothetical protein
MAGELFMRSNEKQSLKVFGDYLFAVLGVKIDEIRNSDNVAGGRYLVGKTCGLRLRLEAAEDREFGSYDFLLWFEPLMQERGASSLNLDTFADVIAKYLDREGLAVARPLAFGTFDTRSVEYGP